MKNQLKSLLSRPEISALVITIVLIIVCTFLSDRFLNTRNFMVILAAYPEYALVALGVTILMISGEFDLSVGSVFAVAPIVTVILVNDGYNQYWAVTLGLLSASHRVHLVHHALCKGYNLIHRYHPHIPLT